MLKSITAAQRLDSRGKPTVQVRVTTEHGIFQAIVPSGASKGDYEACELRDEDKAAYQGNGVLKAVSNIETIIAPVLLKSGFHVGTDIRKIDSLMREIDGTADKSRLGANAILAVSMACARAGSAAKAIPLYDFLRKEAGLPEASYVLPVPFFNVLNGGVHSGNTMAFQEFMIAPTGANSMADAVRIGSEVYQELKKVVKEKFGQSATTLDSRVSLKQYYHKKNFPSFIMGLYRNTPLYCSKTHLRRMTGQHGPHLMKTAR
ncbi:hypothetical protein DH86_00003689 [Scytalidium sp. 3C]|nr:hypothetical protein DH86_00003689 [Scytalidium sp. 3C]